jgi:hypothetical protein
MSRQELVKTRIDLAKQMNEFIINLGDEDIWDIWITEGIPDEPSMDDYEFFANSDKHWNELCELFGTLVKDEIE